MASGGVAGAYARQFDEKLNEYMKMRADFFAFQVAKHVYYERPTHAQLDHRTADSTIELEFLADSMKDRRIRRIEANNVRYSTPDQALRLRPQRIDNVKRMIMEYGIPFEAEKAPGNTLYLMPSQLEIPDIDKELLDQIFTGSHIMPAVGSEIPEVLKKEKWSGYDLPDLARALGYSTPESALEKIRSFYARLLNTDKVSV
jgi:hypothetical protein